MSEAAPDSAYRDGYFAVADGLRLHYRDHAGDGSRPPLLCLPGLTRNARDFADFAERMAPRFRVLCLDLRGRGGSEFDPQPDRYVPPTYARDSIELLDQLGIERAVFVGTSLGGIVTMIVAAFASNRIAAAILNDVGPELTDVGLDRIRNYVGSDASFATWAEAGEAVARNQAHLPASWGDEQWQRMARRMCRVGDDDRIYFDYDPAIAHPFRLATGKSDVDMWPLFDALAKHPLLVIRGQHSELFTDEAMQAMASRSPNVATVTVAGAGHAPELDEPEAVAAIDTFLGRVAD
ncbi:MAG: alpha/beta hydrolase [Pseudomonadota bacterium]